MPRGARPERLARKRAFHRFFTESGLLRRGAGMCALCAARKAVSHQHDGGVSQA